MEYIVMLFGLPLAMVTAAMMFYLPLLTIARMLRDLIESVLP